MQTPDSGLSVRCPMPPQKTEPFRSSARSCKELSAGLVSLSLFLLRGDALLDVGAGTTIRVRICSGLWGESQGVLHLVGQMVGVLDAGNESVLLEDPG